MRQKKRLTGRFSGAVGHADVAPKIDCASTSPAAAASAAGSLAAGAPQPETSKQQTAAAANRLDMQKTDDIAALYSATSCPTSDPVPSGTPIFEPKVTNVYCRGNMPVIRAG